MISKRRVPHVRKGRAIRFDRHRLDEWMERDMIGSVDDF